VVRATSRGLADSCATSENELGDIESEHVARSFATGRWMGGGWE